MITLIYLFMAVAILLVNYLALGHFLERWVQDRNLARFLGFVGLGSSLLAWGHVLSLQAITLLWPLFTFASLWLFWSKREQLLCWRFWQPDAAFVLVFVLVLGLRFLYPSVDPASGQFDGLYFFANFYHADQYPPPDLWMAQQSFDYLPSAMHAFFAINAKLFGLSLGVGFNLAWPLLFGMFAGLLWSLGQQLSLSPRYRAALLVLVLLASTGMGPLARWVLTDTPTASLSLLDAHRAFELPISFVGAYDQGLKFGEAAGMSMPMQLPLHSLVRATFSHALLAIFLLLGLVVSYLWAVQRQENHPRSWWVVAALVPLAFAVNLYSWPLALVVLALALVRKPLPVLCGLVLGLLLQFPYLSQLLTSFSPHKLTWVGNEMRVGLVPLWQFWPVVCLMALAAWVGHQQRQYRLYAELLVLALAGFVVVSLFYLDDPFRDNFERYSTAEQLWGAAYFLALSLLLAAIGRSLQAWPRYTALGLMLVLALSSWPGLLVIKQESRQSMGKIQAHHQFTHDPSPADLLGYLRVASQGTVLESFAARGAQRTGRMAVFSGQPALLARDGDLIYYRYGNVRIEPLRQEIDRFYNGEMSADDMLDFLARHQVQHVLWQPEDVAERAQHWAHIHDGIRSQYQWVPFFDHNDDKVGTFEKRN